MASRSKSAADPRCPRHRGVRLLVGRVRLASGSRPAGRVYTGSAPKLAFAAQSLPSARRFFRCPTAPLLCLNRADAGSSREFPSIHLRHPAPALTRTAVVTLTVTLAETPHVTLTPLARRAAAGSRVTKWRKWKTPEFQAVRVTHAQLVRGTREHVPAKREPAGGRPSMCQTRSLSGRTGEHLSAKPEESLDHAQRRGSLSPVHASYSINTRSAWELTGVFRVTTRNFP